MSIKFTQMPLATVPLAGTERLCIVQDGISKQVDVSEVGGGGEPFVILGEEAFFGAEAGFNDDVPFGPDYNRLVVDTSAGEASITGIEAGEDGQVCIVTNTGSEALNLLENDEGSSIPNRLYGVTSITLPVRGSMFLQYSGILSRWVMV